MARPLKWKSHDGATTTGAGDAQSTKGHDDLALFVEAYNGFDPSNDTLEVLVEGTVDYGANSPEDFAPINSSLPGGGHTLGGGTGDNVSVISDDFVESDENSGRYVAYLGSNSFAVEILRANILSHSGGFDVDSTILVNGSGEAAYRYSTPEGP